MTRATQAIVVTIFGAVLLRLTLFGGYLDYVRAWTRIPLMICGFLLVASSLWSALRPRPGRDDHRPRLAWLLLAPILVVFVIRPPALGAYVAERQVGQAPVKSDVGRPKVKDGKPMALGIGEYSMVAAYNSDWVDGKPVELVGFVSYDKHHHWYVTRLTITCCAADAIASRVRVSGADAPPRNTWVTIVGTGVKSSSIEKALVRAGSVKRIPAPKDPYET